MKRTGVIVLVLTLAGNGLGLIRDLVLAALFGAGAATDAFLAAWTVPETASPLLLEGLMALVGIPFLTRAVTAGRTRAAVAATFWPVIVALVALAAAVMVAAPLVVSAIVPGIADPELAAQCLRLAAPTIPLLGAAGYLSALLRAHDDPVVPAGVYLAYNIGIIATMTVGSQVWGVRAAAAGLTVGAATMCLLLAPRTWRQVGLPGWRVTRARQWLPALSIGGPLLVYLLARQGQTYVQRFFASFLEAGSMSELNYAQKVGQVPGTLAVALALAGFAAIAREMAEGRDAAAAATVVRRLRTVLALVIPSTVGLAALAPLVISVLFERGNFGASDAAATADVLRIYVIGLPAQALVSVLVIAAAALGAWRWLPATAAGLALAVTAIVSALLGRPLGTVGIAAADAAGIWAAAAIMMRGVWRTMDGHTPPGTLDAVVRTTAASLVAGGAAFAVAAPAWGPSPVRLLCAVVVATTAGLGAARIMRARDLTDLVPTRLGPWSSRSRQDRPMAQDAG